MLRCIFGPNLVILAWTADELWCGQAQNGVKFDFQVKIDRAMSYGADKLVIDTHTHRPTDTGNDNTRRPKLASGNKSSLNAEIPSAA